MKTTWFITGSSRGLGRALTEAVLEAGHTVFATARQPSQLSDLVERYGPQIRTFALDVTSAEAAEHAVAEAVAAFGRIDIVVNNAGFGFFGAFEELTPAEFRGQIDANFWGVVNVTRAALPVLRRQREGRIIQVTSVGGRAAFPGLSGYHASKFAVEGLSEALAAEVAPLGIKLTVVEPGSMRTDWSGSSMGHAKPIAEYRNSMTSIRRFTEGLSQTESGEPRRAAEAILRVAELPEPPLRLLLGSDALAVARATYQRNLELAEKWVELTRSIDRDGLAVSDTDHAILNLNRS
jgi:NAD(P)-dependent dehydrogenase (short-subunit alcohol dehydrogenase family)